MSLPICEQAMQRFTQKLGVTFPNQVWRNKPRPPDLEPGKRVLLVRDGPLSKHNAYSSMGAQGWCKIASIEGYVGPNVQAGEDGDTSRALFWADVMRAVPELIHLEGSPFHGLLLLLEGPEEWTFEDAEEGATTGGFGGDFQLYFRTPIDDPCRVTI